MSQQPLDMDPDRTVIIPSPHGRSAPLRNAATAAADDTTPTPTGINALVAAANPLLDIVPQIRATLQHPDPVALRSALVRDIKLFESRARAAGVDPEKIVGARYALSGLFVVVVASKIVARPRTMPTRTWPNSVSRPIFADARPPPMTVCTLRRTSEPVADSVL